MSHPGDELDNNEVDDRGGREPQSAGALTQATQDRLETSYAQQNKTIGEFYAPRAKMYDQLAASIRARSAGPSLSERLAQISGALGQKTEYSGMGAMFSNLSPVLAAQQKAKREEQFANEDLATKYQVGRMGEEESMFEKQLTAQQKMDLLRARYNGRKKQGRYQISGGAAWDRASGVALPVLPPEAIGELFSNPTPENFQNFEKRFGPGSVRRAAAFVRVPDEGEEE